MKRFFLLAFCCCFSVLASAQVGTHMITIRGAVIDSLTSKPLAYVTVALLDIRTQQSLKGTLTKDDGSFELADTAGKEYQLVLVTVGYQNKTIKIDDKGSYLDIGEILLAPSNNQLKEVTISGVKPIMKQEVDRISYNVQADPESNVITVLDMMRKVPLLSVDGSDAIRLKGSGNYKILLNGKESALLAKNPSDVLKSMPAANIEKIEVITVPPAKYDAEGLAGIINIITKKNTAEGYNATIALFLNSVYGPEATVNGNIKQGKLGISLFALDDEGLPFISGFGNNQTVFGSQSTLQNGINNTNFNNHYGNADLSYEIDSLNLLTASLLLFEFNNNQINNQFSNTLNDDGSVAQQYRQIGTGYNDANGADLSINYQLGFKRNKDQLLTFSYKYDYSPNTQYSNNLFSQRLNFLQSAQPDFNQYNNAGDKDHTFQVDYAEPFKNVTLETGGKLIIRNNFSNFQRSDLDSATSQYKVNPAYTDNFSYHQDVYSLYNSYQVNLDKWAVKGGLRLEHTSINADFTSANATVDQNYNNLIPSISIQRSFGSNSLNFGFTQRIQRPSIYQLNPFIDNSDPKFLVTGNPNLRPELNNTFELTYSSFSTNSFNAGLNYAFSNNSIQNVTNLQIDSTANKMKDTVTTTTFQNLGSNRSLGINISTNIAVTKRLTLTLNGQLTKIWLSGAFNGQFYKNTGYTGSGLGNVDYKFDSGYRFDIDANFISGNVTLQGRTNNAVFTSFVAYKEFSKKRITVGLVANNPYGKFLTLTTTNTTSQFYDSAFNQAAYRSFAVRLRYTFGKLNGEIRKNQHGIINDDEKAGGKNPVGS